MRRDQRQRLKKLKDLKLEQREKRLPKDPVRLFTEILRIKPYPYQARFLHDKSPLKVLCWCRRAEKTVMSGDDIYSTVNNPNCARIVERDALKKGGVCGEHLHFISFSVEARFSYRK